MECVNFKKCGDYWEDNDDWDFGKPMLCLKCQSKANKKKKG